MSTDKQGKGGDYDIGHGKPPKAHQFRKGESGNPKGRPKSKATAATDVTAILDQPVKVRTGGRERIMSTFEASFRQCAKRAVDGDLRSMLKFIKFCEDYGVIVPPPMKQGGGVIVAPKGVDFSEWLDSVTEEVPIDDA